MKRGRSFRRKYFAGIIMDDDDRGEAVRFRLLRDPLTELYTIETGPPEKPRSALASFAGRSARS